MDSRKIENRMNLAVKKFELAVKKKFAPTKFILFGSRAKGNAFVYSDYDFLIVSNAFDGMNWLDRISKIVELWDCEANIDVLPYTPKEFERKKFQRTIVQQAVKEGIAI